MGKESCLSNIINTYIKIKESNTSSRKELAEEFQVSERTITNYINCLRRDFNMEINYEKQRYKIADNGLFKEIINRTNLKSEDIWLIILILFRTQYLLPTKIKILEKELLKYVNEKEKSTIEKLFSFEQKGNTNEYYHENTLKIIFEAFVNKKKVFIRYEKFNEDISRYTLIPQNITFDKGKVYLLALNEKLEERTFRLDRIRDISVLNENAKEYEFSLQHYLSEAWNMFGGEETKVVVKFNKKAAKVISEKLGTSKKVLAEENGFTTYEFITKGIEGIAIELLGFGDGFEVLEPMELRSRICEMGKRIAENNLVEI